MSERSLSDGYGNAFSDPKLAPRDGGGLAWLQCASAFFLMLNSWGIVNTFGSFQSYYQIDVLRDVSASDISWIGSLQTFLLIFGGLTIGPLFDKGYLNVIVGAGTVLIVLGLMMTSLCQLYWQFVLAQGLLVGLGCACLFTPSVAIVPRYFQKRRALALGIVASGSSIGGIVYPILFNHLVPSIGFGWAVRIIAFIVLSTLGLPVVGLRWKGETTPSKKGFDTSAWREPPYTLFAVSSFFGFLGIYIPFFYMQFFAISQSYVPSELGIYLLSLLNAGSFFGRLIPTYLADIFGPLNVMLVCTLALSIVSLCWLAIKDEASIIVFCLLFGFFSGAFVALSPAVVATLTQDVRLFGARLGMILVPASIGVLIGNPIAGTLLGRGWVSLQVYGGVIIAASFAFMGIVKVILWKR